MSREGRQNMDTSARVLRVSLRYDRTQTLLDIEVWENGKPTGRKETISRNDPERLREVLQRLRDERSEGGASKRSRTNSGGNTHVSIQHRRPRTQQHR
jgi:hypothetical protein